MRRMFLASLFLASTALAQTLTPYAESPASPLPAGPSAVAGAQGFALTSTDGAFVLNLHAHLQVDGRFFLDSKPIYPDTFLIRRARPILDVTIYRFISGRIMPDFAQGQTVLYDAFLNVQPVRWL